MAQTASLLTSTRRLATYSYLRPLIAGRRVVELGCGTGAGAAHLLSLGADSVVGVDDASVIDRARQTQRRSGLSFASTSDAVEAGRADVIVIPEAEGFLRGRAPLSIAACKRALGGGGRLICVVASADRKGARDGLGFYDVVEALQPAFGPVRMFGLTPFAAFGLAEFEESPGGLRVDAGLIDEANEEPTHYVVVAGGSDEPSESLGYALVQVPAGSESAAPARAPVSAPADDSGLRQKLAEVQGQHEGVLRVSRAQAEEIEELRGRLRRGAESRAALDEEVARLRRALTEADESVLNLTRRTTEEMASLAQRITSGLRIGGEGPGPRDPQVAKISEELRRRERELAERESALSDRDERIAALEAERQDLTWRLQQSAAKPASAASPGDEELRAKLRLREQAIDQFQRAAAAHVDETTRMRAALDEQATLIAELEEAARAVNARVAASEEESKRLRKQAQEAEEQDRARRSRLSELEGTLLRLQRQADQAAAAPVTNGVHDAAVVAEAERRAAALASDVRNLESRLGESDRLRRAFEQQHVEAAARVAELVPLLAERDSLRAAHAALEVRLASTEGNRVDPAELAAVTAEVSRLRVSLQASEAQLWEAKGQLLIDRERITVLEHQLAEAQAAPPPPVQAVPAQKTVSEAAHRSILETVFRELSTIENALRLEIVEVSALEREIAEWRAAVAASEARVRLSP